MSEQVGARLAPFRQLILAFWVREAQREVR